LRLYLDTAVLVSALTNEADTDRVLNWLGDQSGQPLFISHWVQTEFSSALALKFRMGKITSEYRAEALDRFATMKADSFKVARIADQHFTSAARMSDQSALGLRAGDALHLAIVLDIGATLCTLDKKFAAAAEALNAKVQIV
jgi:uncharacterized protein